MKGSIENTIGNLSFLALNVYIVENIGPFDKFTFLTPFLENNPIYILVLLLGFVHYFDTDFHFVERVIDTLSFTLKLCTYPYLLLIRRIRSNEFRKWNTPNIDMRDNYSLTTKSNVRRIKYENKEMKIVENAQSEKEVYIREK